MPCGGRFARSFMAWAATFPAGRARPLRAGRTSRKWPKWWNSFSRMPSSRSAPRAGARDIVLAGRVDRPKFSQLKLDSKGMMVLPRVVAAARKGDDALLRAMVEIFEAEGFRAVSLSEAAPGLVCGEGALGRVVAND